MGKSSSCHLLRRFADSAVFRPCALHGVSPSPDADAEDTKPTVTLSTSQTEIYEGEDAIFTFTVNPAISSALTVHYHVSDQYDATSENGIDSVVIAANSTSKQIKVSTQDMVFKDSIHCTENGAEKPEDSDRHNDDDQHNICTKGEEPDAPLDKKRGHVAVSMKGIIPLGTPNPISTPCNT